MTQAPSPTSNDAGHDPASAQAGQVIIKCAALTKIFRDFWLRNRVKAVDNIDLEVHRGEVFGLLGPNGSGKSTTVKMILGLLHPTSGRIAIFNKHPRDVSIKEQIGYLPEESYLYRFLNARETLEYYARLFHQGRRQRKHRIDMLLEMVGLDKVAHRPVGEFSKGMQRRIGLAQALINDPQLLILDEPTTGLDPIGTRQIKDLIRELAERGKTVLLCSHLLADVEDVCDRVSIMYGGRIRQAGSVDELLVRSGMTDIQAADLSQDDIQAIEQLLESRGKHIERVDQPRQRLETLFLDIVHAAQSEGAETSGAGSGGQIAEFLTARAAHMPEDADAEQVIEELVQPEHAESAASSEADESTASTSAHDQGTSPSQGEESEVIGQLVGDQPRAAPDGDGSQTPAPQTPAGAPRSSEQAAPQPNETAAANEDQSSQDDDDVDRSVLDSLMGGDQEKTQDNSEKRKQE